MTTIIQTGTKYDLYDSSIQTHQSLPAGIVITNISEDF